MLKDLTFKSYHKYSLRRDHSYEEREKEYLFNIVIGPIPLVSLG